MVFGIKKKLSVKSKVLYRRYKDETHSKSYQVFDQKKWLKCIIWSNIGVRKFAQ